MSCGYLDIIKDTLYADRIDNPRRRDAQKVIYKLTISLIKIIAPIMPNLSEEVCGFLPREAINDIDSNSLFSIKEIKGKEEEISSFDYEIMNQLLNFKKSINAHFNSIKSVHVKSISEMDIVMEGIDFMDANIQIMSNKNGSDGSNDNDHDHSCIKSKRLLSLEEQKEILGCANLIIIPSKQYRLIDMKVGKGYKCPRCWISVCESEGDLCNRCLNICNVI